jgi:hypothetical protein
LPAISWLVLSLFSNSTCVASLTRKVGGNHANYCTKSSLFINVWFRQIDASCLPKNHFQIVLFLRDNSAICVSSGDWLNSVLETETNFPAVLLLKDTCVSNLGSY